MQESYLSNESDQDSQDNKIQIAVPEKKMYGIQFGFMSQFKNKMSEIQSAIQQVLVSLTNCQEGQKKRLPYSVLRSFQKGLKQLRKLKQVTIEENKKYSQELVNRQKQKIAKNALFKQYLIQLNDKKQQLKHYISKVETIVRKLEDTGYAQFIQFDVVVPQMNTIRFSYQCRTLTSLFMSRDENSQAIKLQLKRRRKLLNQIQKYIIKDSRQQKIQQTKNAENKIQNKNKMGLCILAQNQLKLIQVLKYFKIFKYFTNQRVLVEELIKIRNKKQQHRLQIQRLKQGLKATQQKLYVTKLRNDIIGQQKNITKTDNLIYMKQMQSEIKQQVDTRIFRIDQNIHKFRSRSCEIKNSIY